MISPEFQVYYADKSLEAKQINEHKFPPREL